MFVFFVYLQHYEIFIKPYSSFDIGPNPFLL